MSNKELSKLIAGAPKVELHLHLEGSIPLNALWKLVEKYNEVDNVGSLEELEKRFTYRDFPHFINTWVWKNSFLREYEDFTFIASEVARDLAQQNIVYVEAFYSPGDFHRQGLELAKITEAIRKGLNQHQEIEILLVADLIRDFGPEKGMMWLEQVLEVRDQGVIGVGIGGSEQLYPPEPYEDVFEKARKAGLYTSAHAGEVVGPKSIWGAVEVLRVDRIGHGTHAQEDEKLVAYLKEKQIPIEMCPISNLCTGSVKQFVDHPIRKFYQEELMVTVNTDDPKMFHTSLVEEYLALVENFQFEIADIQQLMHNSIFSSWASEEKKSALEKQLKDYFANLLD